MEKDPDQRVQQAIQLVFSKMIELGSVRQVLVWFRQQNICLPSFCRDHGENTMVWRLPVYRSLWAILTASPLYAGAYAFRQKRGVRTKIVDGRARRSKGHLKPRSTWTVLIQEQFIPVTLVGSNTNAIKL